LGRVIGDGGIYYYIQDVFVHPNHQNKGNGKKIMDAIMNYFSAAIAPGTFIGLMAAKGAAGFYKKYGFECRDSDRPGMFKIWGEID